MLDFGALPPEVNSGRLYAGPGSGPIMAAASAWQAMAGQLESVVREYSAVIASLQGETWSGNASTAMADAATPYVEWIATAAAKAEETAGQARAAAAAYEAAFAAAVPPALVAANRVQYAALVMANVFGQYTAQIAAAEAAYADMWAQDAQAMYGYASASSAATALTPFTEPPETTTATAQSAQAAAVTQAAGSSGSTTAQSTLSQLLASVPKQLQSLATAGSSTAATDPSASLLTAFSNFNTLAGPTSLGAAFSRTATSGGSFLTQAYRTGLQAQDLPKIAAEGAGAAAGKAAGGAQSRYPSLGCRRHGAAGARRNRQGRTDRRAVSPADLGFGDPGGQRGRRAAVAVGGGPRGGSGIGDDDGRHVGRADGGHDPAARYVVAPDGQQHLARAGRPLQDAPPRSRAANRFPFSLFRTEDVVMACRPMVHTRQKGS